MRKKIFLLTLRKRIASIYEEELNEIFGEYLEIVTYSYEEKGGIRFKEDFFDDINLILLTSNDLYTNIRSIVSDNIPIIFLDFTFKQELIEVLKTYPKDTNAYIGFKSYMASFKTVSLLYSLGLKNMNISVYNPKKDKVKENDIAIVSNNSSIFDGTQKNLISLGDRKLAFTTVMDIATILGIIDDELENRIFDYCRDNAKHVDSAQYFHDQFLNADVQLNTIINAVDDALVVLDENYEIKNYNKRFMLLFGIVNNPANKKIQEVFNFDKLNELILHKQEFKEKLVSLTKIYKDILITKKEIHSKHGYQNMYIFIFKDVTDVMNLQNSLRNQLRSKGYISKYNFDMILGESEKIKKTVEMAKRVSLINKTTLIVGESGTGKELFAQSIHNASNRSKYPFVAVNCATIPTNLLESELFGYEEGAFTGAKKGGRAGLFEKAHRGVLFLDEIGEISLELQAKLLRVIEEKEIMRVGGNEIIPIDVRIVAATNKNLKNYVENDKFRLDLFFRLNTITIKIPPLRERREDIKILINNIIENEGCKYKTLTVELQIFLTNYNWEGNIRELKNCIEYMCVVSDDIIEISHLPEYMVNTEFNSTEKNFFALDNAEPIKLFTNFHENLAAMEILKVLAEKPHGRKKLLSILQGKNIVVSEYLVRAILSSLREKDYVSFGKGRAGVLITNTGKKLLHGLI